MLVIIFIGLGFEAKMQVILLGIVGITIFNFFVGSFIPPNHEKQLHGIIGYSCKFFFSKFEYFRHMEWVMKTKSDNF